MALSLIGTDDEDPADVQAALPSRPSHETDVVSSGPGLPQGNVAVVIIFGQPHATTTTTTAAARSFRDLFHSRQPVIRDYRL